MTQKNFASTVKFESRLGLIVVPVYIEGEQYDFLLDTGAPTVVSSELAAKLQLPILAKQQVSDSQQGSEGMSFSRLGSITLGGVEFTDIGVAMTDLNASTDIRCLDIDGLLGSNFLSKAEWKFNYNESRIEFASSLDSFEIGEESLEVPIGFTLTKTPVMLVRLRDIAKEKRVAIDLGSNGGFSLKTETFRTLQEGTTDLPYSVWYGTRSGGLYGEGFLDTTYTLDVSTVSFGDVFLAETSIDFEEQEMSTVGSAFFENYDVVMSWKKKKMWLSLKYYKQSYPPADFGVSFGYVDRKLVVRKLYGGSSAALLLKVGDQVISWADESYEFLTQQGYCVFLQKTGPQDKKAIIVIDRAGERLEFTLDLQVPQQTSKVK